jgi:hypothetical protein
MARWQEQKQEREIIVKALVNLGFCRDALADIDTKTLKLVLACHQ